MIPSVAVQATTVRLRPRGALVLSLDSYRVLCAANELGWRTVATYSQEDRLGLHRFKADEAYLVGQGSGPVQAYLDVGGIVELAKAKVGAKDLLLVIEEQSVFESLTSQASCLLKK